MKPHIIKFIKENADFETITSFDFTNIYEDDFVTDTETNDELGYTLLRCNICNADFDEAVEYQKFLTHMKKHLMETDLKKFTAIKEILIDLRDTQIFIDCNEEENFCYCNTFDYIKDQIEDLEAIFKNA